MPRPVTIRRSLLVNLATLIVLLGLAILVVTFAGARRAVRTLSRAVIAETLDRTEVHLQGFFDPVMREIAMARAWGREGLLDTDRPERLDRLFVPLIRQHRQISSLMVADDRGREYMLLRTTAGWTRRQTRRDEWGARTHWAEWTPSAPTPVESERELDYDPRARPWFTGAVDRRDGMATAGQRPTSAALTHWTAPYTFFTTQDPGITASAVFDGGDDRDHVIGFDVLLRDISRFTAELSVSDHGGVFVLTDDDLIIGLPRHERWADAEARRAALLKRPEDLDWNLPRDAARALDRTGAGAEEPARFMSGGLPWWGAARRVDIGPGRTLRVAVAIPEADLVGDLHRIRLWIIGLTIVAVAIAIARAAGLARRFSHPIERLVGESERISRGDLEPGTPIESSVAEVRVLAHAHDRMRAGLQSLMKLERDLQVARQIQQSTFPRELPDLPGFDIAAWSEPAEETGGDTYDVIHYTYDVVAAGDDGNDDRALMLLADATGHGIGPALSATQVRSMLRMGARGRLDLDEIARHLNDQLCADLPPGRFVTAWLGMLDARACTLRTFSAAQGPILLLRAARGVVERLDTDAPPFGISPDLEIALPPPVGLEPGDVVAVISDGIFEASGPDGGLLGADRVCDLIAARPDRSAAELMAAIREAVDAFTAGRPADDDRTAIIIRRG
ncbi:MAG: SpoIIE family protein phosphatase [Planctomycetota bacterium]|jgi:serine phosphatase RsbU (regulator of sigma subunit)